MNTNMNTLLDETRYGKISLFEDSRLPAVKMPPPSSDDYDDQDNELNKEVTSYKELQFLQM
jgi:hypothetical protein